MSSSSTEISIAAPPLRVGIVKGRSFAHAITYAQRWLGLNPRLVQDSPRCYEFQPEIWSLPAGGDSSSKEKQPSTFTIQYTLISPRDVGDFLSNKLVDVVIGYDDTLYHLKDKNYHIKPLFQEFGDSIDARVCLVGKAGTDVTSASNVIVSEYDDACHLQSSFEQAFRGVQGKWITAHGVSESMVANGFATMCVAVVESGDTIKANGLVVLKELRNMYMNAFVNADNPRGEQLLRVYRPTLKYVYIDGIDGSGKTTMVNLLKKEKRLRDYVIKDRGVFTSLSLLDYNGWNANLVQNDSNHIQLILDCNPISAHERIMMRDGGMRSPRWHSVESLRYFKFKYLELAAHYGAWVASSVAYINPVQFAKHVLDWLTAREMVPTPLICKFPVMRTMTQAEFDQLVEIARGESKIVRRLNDKWDVIQYIPSIYSHKKKRAGFIEGSATERLTMTRYVLNLLAYEGIPHTYVYIGENFILARPLSSPPPPVEIVVKTRYAGTDKYRYVGLDKHVIPFKGEKSKIVVDAVSSKYPAPYVRFDWRNANNHPEGDVAMSEELAKYLIDVDKAKKLALSAFSSLSTHFARCDIDIWDFCLFITADGDRIFGEISQDNGRYRRLSSGDSLDKDVWRAGGSSEDVLEKWKLLSYIVRRYVRHFFQETFGAMQE